MLFSAFLSQDNCHQAEESVSLCKLYIYMELTLRIHYFSCCYRVTCIANNNNKYLALQMKHFWCAAATKSKVRNAAGTGMPCLGFPRNAAQAQASSGAAVETVWRKPKEVQKFHSNLDPNEKRSQFIDGQKQYPWSLFVSRTQPYRNAAQSTPGSPAASLLAACNVHPLTLAERGHVLPCVV